MKWTIMVYMAGDNDLSEDMTLKLVELQTYFQNNSKLDNIGLLVYFDGGNPLTETRLFDFTQSPNPNSMGKDPFFNAADPQSVYKFVEWCIKDRQAVAENYALLFSGHGDGFQRTAFMRDMTSFDFMTVAELKEVLEKINKDILGVKKLPVLAFDSCVMSMVEVAKEFTGAAEIFLGSEGYMPTTGLSYDRFVKGLATLDLKPDISAEDISNLIVQSAKQHNRNYAELQMRSLDMSVVDLDEQNFDAAVASLHKLGDVLTQTLEYPRNTDPGLTAAEKHNLTGDAVEKIILNAHWKCQTFLFDQAVDVIDFCRQLKIVCVDAALEKDVILRAMKLNFIRFHTAGDEIQDIEIAAVSMSDETAHKEILKLIRALKSIVEACNQTLEAFGKCVILSAFSGPNYQFAKGIAVFFPWAFHTFEMTRFKFKEYSFACKDRTDENSLNPWYKFLEQYLANTARPVIDTNVVYLDPPPKGMLASESQYKEYFMRVKNLSLVMTVPDGESRRP